MEITSVRGGDGESITLGRVCWVRQRDGTPLHIVCERIVTPDDNPGDDPERWLMVLSSQRLYPRGRCYATRAGALLAARVDLANLAEYHRQRARECDDALAALPQVSE